jgi:glutaredoxin
MFEYFHLYICTLCPFCKDAMDLLEKEKKDFVVTVMDRSPRFRQGVAEEFKFKTVPLILQCASDGTTAMVGGYRELKELLGTEKEPESDDKVQP